MTEAKRILFVSSEIYPFLPQSEMAFVSRYLPQAIQESGGEIRSFMPGTDALTNAGINCTK